MGRISPNDENTSAIQGPSLTRWRDHWFGSPNFNLYFTPYYAPMCSASSAHSFH
jgi:hypothetical protein